MPNTNPDPLGLLAEEVVTLSEVTKELPRKTHLSTVYR